MKWINRKKNLKAKHLCLLSGMSILIMGCTQSGADSSQKEYTASFQETNLETDSSVKTDSFMESVSSVESDAFMESDSSVDEAIELPFENDNQLEETVDSDTFEIEETACVVIPEEEWEMITVLDAWNEWHEMKVNPYVSPNPYCLSAFSNDGQTVSYQDSQYSIRKGIDVSRHQGKINWEKVKNDSIDFAILRIGYRTYGSSGTLKKDEQFENNYTGAINAGLDVGVYIFSQAINEEEALEEAEYVLDILDGRELQLPIVYDPEILHDTTARTDDVTGEQFTKNTLVFCEAIKAAGYDVMVYSNIVFEHEYFDMEQLQQYPIWYADYEELPQSPYDFSFWQYSCEGRVDGIGGYVDLNLQFISGVAGEVN